MSEPTTQTARANALAELYRKEARESGMTFPDTYTVGALSMLVIIERDNHTRQIEAATRQSLSRQ